MAKKDKKHGSKNLKLRDSIGWYFARISRVKKENVYRVSKYIYELMVSKWIMYVHRKYVIFTIFESIRLTNALCLSLTLNVLHAPVSVPSGGVYSIVLNIISKCQFSVIYSFLTCSTTHLMNMSNTTLYVLILISFKKKKTFNANL